MKNLITAVAILGLIVALLIGDSFWICSVCDDFDAYIARLSDSEADFSSETNLAILEEAAAFWEKNEFLLDLSLNEEAFERTKEYLICACESAKNDSFCDYEFNKRLFAAGISKMRDNATVSLGKIF